jgi:hypothetical protein
MEGEKIKKKDERKKEMGKKYSTQPLLLLLLDKRSTAGSMHAIERRERAGDVALGIED